MKDFSADDCVRYSRGLFGIIFYGTGVQKIIQRNILSHFLFSKTTVFPIIRNLLLARYMEKLYKIVLPENLFFFLNLILKI